MCEKRALRPILFFLFLALLLSSIAAAGTVKRTSLLVDKLSCGSCLATIEAQLKKLGGAIGMQGDASQGLVVVDHRDTLSGEAIASAISDTGYPARVDWTASIAEQNVFSFQKGSRYAGGCGGSCGTSGQQVGGPSIWNTAAAVNGKASLTTMQVSKLSCISCINTIADGLRSLVGTIGMDSDIRRGLVAVKHNPRLSAEKIATSISGLGYPARIISTDQTTVSQNSIPTQAKNTSGSSLTGRSGCNSRGCNATADAWKKLYQRYVKQPADKQ